MHAKTSPNIANKDEFTLAQAEKPELKFEWPSWWEALKKELTSLIIVNDVFDITRWEDVPIEKREKIQFIDSAEEKT